MPKLNFINMYYLGPNGSNSHNAMLSILKNSEIFVENHIPQKSIKMVFESMKNDENSICVLPIENSIEGIVRETIDNLAHNNSEVKIQGEITLPIKHLLLSTGNDKTKIKVIMSHPQALSQCSSYLYKEFPNAELKETASTSFACEKIQKLHDETIAAIANETCASLFGLNVLSKDINDEKDNKTRFYLLSSKNLEKQNDDVKTAMIVSTKNEPGALCNVLKVIENNKINLSYIDSRPSKRELGEYIFFMELEKSETSEEVKSALKELPEFVNYVKILGSYKKYN